METEVLEKKILEDRSFYLKLRCENIIFKAGQFVMVNWGRDREGIVKRAYSIASPPFKLPYIELLIRTKDKSRSLPFLLNLKKGDKLSIEGPFGNFCLKEDSLASPLFIAGGTGIAPIRSMIYKWLSLAGRPKPFLLFGSRDIKSLYFLKEFVSLKAKKNLETLFVIEEGFTKGNKADLVLGNVPEKIFSLPKEVLEESICYLCGPPEMVRRGIEELKKLGKTEEEIICERF